mgnify:CR=1 FL=1
MATIYCGNILEEGSLFTLLILPSIDHNPIFLPLVHTQTIDQKKQKKKELLFYLTLAHLPLLSIQCILENGCSSLPDSRRSGINLQEGDAIMTGPFCVIDSISASLKRRKKRYSANCSFQLGQLYRNV